MISFTSLQTKFGTISQNSTAANLALGADLMNIEQKYLLQKFFSNEGSFSIQTVGAQTLTLTGTLILGAVSATLNTAWLYYTTTAIVTFSNGNQRSVRVEKGSTAISWDVGLTATATASISVGGLQSYPMPPNYSKLKTLTINIGSLKWTPTEILTREEWDKLNVFPYYGDIPNNYFIYPGGDHGAQVGIWPIPATTGNVLTFNYKFRIPDLSLVDYSTGTVSVTNGSTVLTGAGTTFIPTTNMQTESRWVQIVQPKGDNLWYQIASIDTTTGITLYTPYQGITVSGGNYIIGQMPIIMEDFQDMLLWKALVYYFTAIVDNPGKREQYQEFYNQKLELLTEYAGGKTTSVNLGRRPDMMNPNLFQQNLS